MSVVAYVYDEQLYYKDGGRGSIPLAFTMIHYFHDREYVGSVGYDAAWHPGNGLELLTHGHFDNARWTRYG